MKPSAVLLVLASSMLLVSGCSSGGPKAAEPATAPVPTVAAAGTSRHVGALPQGIVYSPDTNLLAVAVQHPDRLLLLDPTTLAVRTTVPLPGSARHLQLGADGRSVLVPAETANEIVQVALPGGRTTVTKVRKQPHDAAQAPNGDVLVGDEFGRSLSVVRDARVVKTFTDLTQPGGVIADGTTAVVVDVGAFTVSTYDLSTLRRTARLPAGKGPTHGVLVAGHRVLVADTRGQQVLLFADAPLRKVSALPLPGTPYGMASDAVGGIVWITLTALNQVVGLDVTGAVPRVVARYPTVRQPDTVAVAPGSRTLWVTGTDGGTVERITTSGKMGR